MNMFYIDKIRWVPFWFSNMPIWLIREEASISSLISIISVEIRDKYHPNRMYDFLMRSTQPKPISIIRPPRSVWEWRDESTSPWLVYVCRLHYWSPAMLMERARRLFIHPTWRICLLFIRNTISADARRRDVR